jgi:anaerobic magnesium-protoporphyrin IX monomethyl ester cyclase
MPEPKFIIISQSEAINYEQYSKIPLARIDLYKGLLYPRMVRFKEGFRSSLDLINYFLHGTFYSQADFERRRKLLNVWNLPGMNGMYLANHLLQYGIETKVINNFDSEWDRFCEIYSACAKKPLIGLSTTFYLNYTEIQRIAKKLKEFDPDMAIVLGGAFVNERTINQDLQEFEKIMRKNGIKYILHAFNSEEDLKELILAHDNGGELVGISNLAYIDGDFEQGRFIATGMKWNDPVMEASPVLWDRLDVPFVNQTVQMRTASGCSFACAFCSYPQTAHGCHYMSPERVEEHLESILKLPGVNKIIFIDDTFNVPTPRFKKLCQVFAKYDFEWFSFLRVQFINEEIAALMKESGCKCVYLGVESANDVVLKNMNKKATKSQFLQGIELLKKHGVASLAAFVIGFPGETEETIQENIEFIEGAGLDFYTLKEFYYMKHTPIYEQKEKYGLTGIGANWAHSTMDYKTAHKMKIEMFRKIKNSTFIDSDTSLWHLAYLYDQGFSLDDIAAIQSEVNRIVIDQLDNNFDEATAPFQQLQKIIEKRGARK